MSGKIWKATAIAVACGLPLLTGLNVSAQEADAPPVLQNELPGPDDGSSEPFFDPDDPAQTQVLNHGPVHEAFAQPLADAGQADDLVVAKAPPEPINERPPEYMPEGDNVEWIPGYWAWDVEMEDYLWVSGLWRNIPPGQRWVPGYWADIDGSYRWVSGFWTGVETANLDYNPYPPQTIEQGPNVAAPGANYFWVPGCWIYESTAYQWQPGYWAPGYDDWCWIPQQNVWTPYGSIYSPGYWDYRVPNRGLLFSPVWFGNSGYYYGSNWFTPGFGINPGGLLVSLFFGPQRNHYYFGNYYGNNFYNFGYRPWYNFGGFGNRGYRYDPLLSFYDSYYGRRGVDFNRRMDGWFDYYQRNPDRRPPRTLGNGLRNQLDGRGGGNDSPITLARSLRDLAGNNPQTVDALGMRLRRISENQQIDFGRNRDDLRQIVQTRLQTEVGANADGNGLRARIAARAGANGELPDGLQLNDVNRPRLESARDAINERRGTGTLQLPQVRDRVLEARNNGNLAPRRLGEGRTPQLPGNVSPREFLNNRGANPSSGGTLRDAVQNRLQSSNPSQPSTIGQGLRDRIQQQTTTPQPSTTGQGLRDRIQQRTTNPQPSTTGQGLRERIQQRTPTPQPSTTGQGLRDRIQQRTPTPQPSTTGQGLRDRIQQRTPTPQPSTSGQGIGSRLRSQLQSSPSAPQIRQSAPQIRQSAPQIRQSIPQIRQSAPQIRQSAPQIRQRAPQIRQSAPQIRQSAPRSIAPQIRNNFQNRSGNSGIRSGGGGGIRQSFGGGNRGGGGGGGGGGRGILGRRR